MGQFYQTTAPEFLSDKMFKLPAELMADVLMNKEKVVDTDIAAAREFEKLTAQSLAADDPYTKQKLAEYEAETNAIVDGIKGNVMDYGRFNDRTRKLSNDVHREWTTGGIARGEANLKIYNERVAALDEKAKKDPALYPPELVAAIKADAIRKFKEGGGTGYNKDTGTYNTIEVDDALALGNLPDRFNENIGKYIKANSSEKVSMGSDGKWMITDKTGTREVTADKLQQAAYDYVKASPDIISAIQQRNQYGVQGFENPEQYLANSIQSFISTNQFKETTRDLSNKEDVYAKALFDDEREKQKDLLDPFTYFSEDSINSPGGDNVQTFTQNKQATNELISDTKSQALTIFAGMNTGGDLGEMKRKYPEIAARISRGDFSDIKNMPEAKIVINQYRQAQYKKAGLEALEREFEKVQGKTAKNSPFEFNLFLNSRSKIKIDTTQSWQDIDPTMTYSKLTKLNKQYYDDGRYKTGPMRFNKGTMMKVDGKMVDLSTTNFTLNDMIAKGLVEPEVMKSASGISTVKGKIGASGNQLTQDVQTIKYKLTDGTGYINFDVSKGIVPSTGLNDKGNIEMTSVASIRGKNFQVNVQDTQTQSMIDYKNKNGAVLKTRLQLQQWANGDDVVIPGSGSRDLLLSDNQFEGVVYHPKASKIDGKVVPANSVTMKVNGTVQNYLIDSPGVMESLAKLMQE